MKVAGGAQILGKRGQVSKNEKKKYLVETKNKIVSPIILFPEKDQEGGGGPVKIHTISIFSRHPSLIGDHYSLGWVILHLAEVP